MPSAHQVNASTTGDVCDHSDDRAPCGAGAGRVELAAPKSLHGRPMRYCVERVFVVRRARGGAALATALSSAERAASARHMG